MNATGISSGIGNTFQTQGMRPPMNGGMRPPKPNSDEIVSKMTSDLGLSDDQVSKLKSIFSDDSESDNSTNEVKSFDPESMKAKMDAKMEKVKSVLTPDQLTKFNSIMENKQNERQNQMANFAQDGKVDMYL